MKRIYLWLLLAAGLVLSGLLPFRGSGDVSRLQPVRALVLDMEEGMLRVRSDADAEGRGNTLQQALDDLERRAEGVLFLETAEQIVLHKNAQQFLQELANNPRLRPAARVCYCEGQAPDAKQAEAFLRSREGGVMLGHVRAAVLSGQMPKLPLLTQMQGGLVLSHG